jgi:hypothetical protein
MSYAGGGVGRKAKSTGRDVAFDDFIETRFVNGDFTAVQAGNLGAINIDTKHVVSHIRKTSACN